MAGFLFGCKNNRLSFDAGASVPDYTFQAPTGDSQSLRTFVGKPFILIFWASWCETCKSEMPSLIRLKNRFAEKGFEIVAIAVSDTMEKAKAYAKEGELNFFIGLDQLNTASSVFGLTGVPEAFVVDKNGKFVLIQDPETLDATVRIIGPRRWDTDLLASQINRLLS